MEKKKNSMLSKRYAFVDKDRCVACGACTKVCPRETIKIWKGCFAKVEESLCVGCGKCANVCPAGAITITLREGQDE